MKILKIFALCINEKFKPAEQITLTYSICHIQLLFYKLVGFLLSYYHMAKILK